MLQSSSAFYYYYYCYYKALTCILTNYFKKKEKEKEKFQKHSVTKFRNKIKNLRNRKITTKEKTKPI